MVVEFPPADVPASNNVHGTPMPPSALHQSVSPPAVFIPTGWGNWQPDSPSDAPAANVNGSALGRAAAFLGRLLGRG